MCSKCALIMKKELRLSTIKTTKYRIFFIGFYEGKLKKLLLEYKFNEKTYISNYFVEEIVNEKNIFHILREYDCIIPVPMYKLNKKNRGYNQSEIIAKKLAKKLHIEYIKNYLVKIKNNKKQSLLNKIERAQNVKNAYRIKDFEMIKNKRVILFDDIYTTGSTVNECLKQLRKARPKLIDILVIAKTKL